MQRILKMLNKNAEQWALVIIYMMLVLTMFIEVLRRELLSYSSVWGEEIVRYSFIYLVWIGAAAAVRERGHIRIDVIFSFVSPRVKAMLSLLGDIVMLIVALVALFYSFGTVLSSAKYGSVSHGLRISQVWFLSAIPIGFALVILRLVQSFLRDLDDLRHGRPVFEGNKLFD